MEVSVELRIKELIGLINKYDKAYYIDAESIVSDREYDLLFAELIQLEKDYPEFISSESPTQRVSGAPLSEFEQVVHEVPMLSLQNTYSRNDVEDFYKKIAKELGDVDIDFCCELKIDGVAVSMKYKNSQFVTGATRGDGYVGDNITQNLKTVKSLPLVISSTNSALFDIEVRGEAYMNIADFEQINKERAKSGEKLYANPRNTTAGSLKLLDSSIVAKRKIRVITYYLRTENSVFANHSDSLNGLKDLGFPVNPAYKVCKNIDEIFDFINYWEIERHNLPFQTDGIVIKVNSFAMQNELGTVARSPKWAIAYKYETESAETLLNDITIQIGRTGAVTPVAELQPVLLAGSTISRATLHNYDFIAERDIRIGDTVVIEKGGEVIPKVVRIVPELRPPNSIAYVFPEYCNCDKQSKLVRPDGEANYYCLNPECNWQVKRAIEHFASREAMDIEGLGEKVVEQFVDLGLLKNVADIYELHNFKSQISELERWGDRSVENLLQSIEYSKNQSFEKVLFGLGIRFIGQGGAKLLARNFHDIESIINANRDELTAVHEIGEKMADSIIAFFANSNNLQIVERLKSNGIKMTAEARENIIHNQNISGKSFVFTGELESMSRTDAAKLVESMGGKEQKSVSKKTDFVVVGSAPGSKYEKAQKLGVSILDEKGFLELIK